MVVGQEDLETLDAVSSFRDRSNPVNREANSARNATRSGKKNTSMLLMTLTCAILVELGLDTSPSQLKIGRDRAKILTPSIIKTTTSTL